MGAQMEAAVEAVTAPSLHVAGAVKAAEVMQTLVLETTPVAFAAASVPVSSLTAPPKNLNVLSGAHGPEIWKLLAETLLSGPSAMVTWLPARALSQAALNA